MLMMYVDKIYNRLKGTRYEFVDMSNSLMTKQQRKTPEYVIENLKVQTPQEVLKRGVGNCIDQSLCIYYLADKCHLEYKQLYTLRKYCCTCKRKG